MKKLISALLVCGSLSSSAQTDVSDPILERFNEFAKRNVQEKIFVHTDKEFYLAGEIIWYKIFYVDGKTHRSLDLSKVAYVEILDQNNKPVMQAKNALENSSGKGSFFLPSSIVSGNFRLRAYTNWMKNNDPAFYFEKPISIINTFKPLNLPAERAPLKYTAQFFPEGGNLVAGIANRVAFKVTDQFGKSVSFKGTLMNQNGDSLLSFEPLRFGMGTFVLTPTVGQSYKAMIVTADNQSFNAEFPAAVQAGYIVRVTEEKGNIDVTIATNLPDRVNGGQVFVLLHSRQQVTRAEKKTFSNGVAHFSVNKEDLGEGVSQLTVFNSEQQPVCERLLFRQPGSPLNIKASSSSETFALRSKVSIDIATVYNGKGIPANLSLAVHQADSVSTAAGFDLQSYLLLNSDIRGVIESPNYYFSSAPDVLAAADNLMMTQGWRRFSWNQPMRKTPEPPAFAPEFDGHIMEATVTYNAGQQPAGGVKAYLSVPGNKMQFYPSVTNAEGKAWFDIRNYYGKSEVVLLTEPLRDSNYRIEIADPFSQRYSVSVLPEVSLNASHQKFLVNHSIAVQALNAYRGDSLTRFELPSLDSNPFYGKYTKRYLLDDYVRFSTMEEVLREYVPEVGIKKTGGLQRVRIADWDQLKYLEGEPLLLIDGVPVTHKQLLAYDPMKVRKLEVVTNRYITGKFVFDGIASFSTYSGNMPEFVFDPKTIIVDYEGLQLDREFYSPVYVTEEQKASRIPDFRSVLSWQPDVSTDTGGKATVTFFTSDRPGRYLGVLHGIDHEGRAATQTFTFEVTK